MQYRKVGNQLSISVIGQGGYEFGEDPEWRGGKAVLDAALESGVNWIDTAEEYHHGVSEETIAAALAGRRDEFFLSSKVAPLPDGTGHGRDQIKEACTKSLARLGTDHLDIYFLHWPEEGETPLEESWEGMRALVGEGLVRCVGLSNYEQADVERCLAVGPVDILQEGLSPIDHLETRELAAWAAARNIAVVTYEPLGNGMLAGAISSPEDFVRVVGEGYEEWDFWKRLFAPGRFERSLAVADGMRAAASEIGCSLAQVALAWNLHQPGVTATLAGTTNPSHVRDNADAASIILTTAQLAVLNEWIPLGPTFAAG